jgi:hypothetical protein
MLFCWPIAGHQQIQGQSGPASGCHKLQQRPNSQNIRGLLKKAVFEKNNQKSVGLFTDFQWLCTIMPECGF